MHPLKQVRIRNFRSIVDQAFDLGALTVIVGANDAGKSNFLRALNLFFNSETDPGRPFDFSADFSTRASVGKGKARQIEVSLDLEPPEGFSNRNLVRWKRYWREGVPRWVSEELFWLNTKDAISGASKIKPWCDRIKYKYVPAIKGREYFTLLLRDLHDTLAETVDSELRAASTDFIRAIRQHTDSISETVSKSLGLRSHLQLPANLRSLFEVLDFETTSDSVPTSRSLQLRGDGVKVRHIAAILKFLADQDKKLSAKGKIRPTTIWGYEEPENNLELRRAAQHADELLQYSDQIQIVLTTHSPAFYSLVPLHPLRVVGLIAIGDKSGTRLEPFTKKSTNELDESLGLMPLVAPYIMEQTRRLEEQERAAEETAAFLRNVTKPIVIVAGETDAEYIEAALKTFRPDLVNEVRIEFIGMSTQAGSKGGGDSSLDSIVRHWESNPTLAHKRVLAIYDCDAKCRPRKSDSMLVRQLPRRVESKVATKGIENLIPDEFFLDAHYDSKEEIIDYGGKKVTKVLNKKRLCRDMCDPDAFHGSAMREMKDRFSAFCLIFDWIDELIALPTPTKGTRLE